MRRMSRITAIIISAVLFFGFTFAAVAQANDEETEITQKRIVEISQ